MSKRKLDLESKIRAGFETAFINSDHNSDDRHRPELIYNDPVNGRKVLSALEDELDNCDEFFISVAFITMGGLTPLLMQLDELNKKQVKGRILTTDYLSFTQPKALEKLSEFKNIEVRLFDSANSTDGFHTKGYIFKQQNNVRVIVGSANITNGALTSNKEWNTKFSSLQSGSYAHEILDQFEDLWSHPNSKVCDEIFIEQYKTKYEIACKQRKQAKQLVQIEAQNNDAFILQPNKMQVGFVNNLKTLVQQGKDKALLISATATGKTFASAFGLRELKPKRILFLVHVEQIARSAMQSYQQVFGNKVSYGLMTGNKQEADKDFIFSTMQMMAKQHIHSQFSKHHFDCVVIDEVHHAGAPSYQTIMNYFKPKLWLGMSASPDRLDGFDVYKLFDYNIANEIRFMTALEQRLICPFHYFGITDVVQEGVSIVENDDFSIFNNIEKSERVSFITSKIKTYGYSGNRVKGLIFVSRKEDGKTLSAEMNRIGYRTEFVSGEDSVDRRNQLIDRLTSDDTTSDCLDYLISVNIFNEGVDIPSINQLVMLRPTESPVIFIQQLGRGLRKHPEKEYTVVLDFIGNYSTNYMIPIALTGDRSYKKDVLRKAVLEGSRTLPGESTIHFDKIAQQRVMNAIDTTNLSSKRIVKESYLLLKMRLGRIPTLQEFDEYGSIDPLRIIDAYRSYYDLLNAVESEYRNKLSNEQTLMLRFISQKYLSGKRPHELCALKKMIEHNEFKPASILAQLKNEYHLLVSEHTKTCLINQFTNQFLTGSERNTFKQCILLETSQTGYVVSRQFRNYLTSELFKKMLVETIEYGLYRHKMYYSKYYREMPFNLYQKYTYEDVSRLFDWESSPIPLNIGGYFYHRQTNTFPIFINYEKSEDISATINYEDRFESSSRLIAISKSGRTMESSDMQIIKNSRENGVAFHLFVRKNKNDLNSKEFYYLGRVFSTGNFEEFVMPNTNSKAVKIEYELEKPVRPDLYDYFLK